MNNDEISIGDFVGLLVEKWRGKSLENSEILRYGHFRGWLEDSDERQSQFPLNRQTAARIIHQFLRIECNFQDLPDITPATVLKDLYNCRVCANHIAQVYTLGIMDAQEYKREPEFSSSPSPVLIFNHLAPVYKPEAEKIINLITYKYIRRQPED